MRAQAGHPRACCRRSSSTNPLTVARLPRLSFLRSAYYYIHKQTQDTVWELDAAELARVRAEAKAAGLSPLP